MKTQLLSTIMKLTWKELQNPESEFNEFNPFREEGDVPFIELSDEDKEKMRKFNVNFEVSVHQGNLICEFNIYQLVQQIQWQECLQAKAGDELPVYLVNDEFVVVPYVNPNGAVYRLALSDRIDINRAANRY